MPINNNLYTVLIIFVVVLCTQMTRVAPFALFGGNKKVPNIVNYLGKVLPPAIMAILIVYCLKWIKWTSYPSGAAELIAIAIVVLLHKWKRNNLLSIGGGTLCYMILVQCVWI